MKKFFYPKPTDTILITETIKPTEYIETNKPNEYIETNKPTEYIETIKPTEYIETTKPTEYIETTKPTEYIETTKPTEYIETDNNSGKLENIYEFTKDEILNDECNSKLTSEQIGDIYSFLSTKINKDSNELIKTENAIFQISTLEEQKNNNDPDTSSIDIGDCEKILKEKEGLSEDEDLIIFKIDIKSDDLSKTYVQYEN